MSGRTISMALNTKSASLTVEDSHREAGRGVIWVNPGVMKALGASAGDVRRLFDGGRSNLLIVVPLLALSSLTWLAAGEPELGGLVSYGFSRLALEAISLGQIVLATLMAPSVLASVALA